MLTFDGFYEEKSGLVGGNPGNQKNRANHTLNQQAMLGSIIDPGRKL